MLDIHGKYDTAGLSARISRTSVYQKRIPRRLEIG